MQQEALDTSNQHMSDAVAAPQPSKVPQEEHLAATKAELSRESGFIKDNKHPTDFEESPAKRVKLQEPSPPLEVNRNDSRERQKGSAPVKQE